MPVEGTTRARSPLACGSISSNFSRPDQLQPGESVRFAPAPQLLQSGKFLFVCGHNDLAADLVGYAVLTAEFDHGSCALDT